VHLRARVLRDGRVGTVDAQAIVPGDVVVSSAGSLVPADALILEATDFFHSEAVLTARAFPSKSSRGRFSTGRVRARPVRDVRDSVTWA
jgi:Mg2+-importing ATPase